MRPLFFVGALGLAGIGAAVLSDYFAHYEEPNYTTDMRDGSFELRSYPSVIAASVQVSGNDDGSANNAFKILAGYIFGKNSSSRKLAMTAPVVREASSQKIAMTVPVTVERLDMSMTMSFYMPAQYTLDTLPEPSDKRIELMQIPARKFAVMRFSGFADEKNCLQKEEELKRWLESQNLKSKGQALRAFYNPPWTLPFLRRNEIWILL